MLIGVDQRSTTVLDCESVKNGVQALLVDENNNASRHTSINNRILRTLLAFDDDSPAHEIKIFRVDSRPHYDCVAIGHRAYCSLDRGKMIWNIKSSLPKSHSGEQT